ncbi:hypothetical protein KP729_002729|uniref:putative phage abortive infection protein n=1 Tax=Delftia acidovorans TaxID=80866 RepID=UPI001C0CC379|nr:putative phage abortive infection protein [Delftia acidovorans]MCA1069357.1 hypothetical protein [Delftia acidovorans]
MFKTILILSGLFIATVVTGIYIVFIFLFTETNISPEKTLFGIFGDTVGGTLNPLLTFFSFTAILFTIWFQKEELRATREELSRAANAHEKNLEKIEAQIKAQEITKFENTFFSFLAHHNTIVAQLTENPPPLTTHGAGNYQRAKKEPSLIDATYAIVFEGNKSFTQARDHLVLHEVAVDHYFRLVYQILKFIDRNYPAEKNTSKNFSQNQKKYSGILRSSINHKILELIAINAASDQSTPSYDGYKELIEKSSFLEHLKFNRSIISETIKIYDKRAFGNSIFLDIYLNSKAANNEPKLHSKQTGSP